jgi:spore maturation protein CgeB
MSGGSMRIVILGLSITSSWGNGHATTWRALVKGLAERGHDILFLERDVPWYAAHRDLREFPWCSVALYRSLDELADHAPAIADADLVIVGSYVPDGIEVARLVQRTANAVTAFYDIDTPVTLAAMNKGTCTYLSCDTARNFDVYLSFTGGPILERIERDLGAPMARALYCSVDPAHYRAQRIAKQWDLSYLGTYAADRQPVLERLLIEPARRAPHLRFAVAGAQYPADIDWPANVERIDHVAPADHPAFYGKSRFTLNATRADMVRAGWSPSVRLFEAAACGTAIISDDWPGLACVLEPGRDVLVARNSDDVTEALETWSERRVVQLAANGRERVLAAHTAAHRAEALERFAGDARSNAARRILRHA